MKIIKNTTEAKEFFFENYVSNSKINISATAKALNVSRSTLYKWIKELKNDRAK